MVFFALAILGFELPIPVAAATYADAEYLIDSWEVEQDLPENSATAMVQTPDGYLWFGTFNGLVRFDGVKFTVFNPSTTANLPSPGIVNLHLDASQRLWISTYDGLAVSEPNRWTVLRREPRWTGDYVRTFSENAGVTCLTSFNGKVLRAQGEGLEELPEPPGVKSVGYLGHVDRSGRIWIEQDYREFSGFWDKGSSGGTNRSNNPPKPQSFFGYWDGHQWCRSKLADRVANNFRGMTGLRDGSLLVVTAEELLRIDEEKIVSRRPLRLPAEMREAWSVNEDRQGNIWINTHGLFRIQPSGEVRYFCTTNGLTYDSLRFTFEDREGNLWVGTSGGGLMRFKPRAFVTYGPECGLTVRNVKALLEEAPGKMLIGTFGGGLFSWENGRVSHLEVNRQPFSLWPSALLLDRDRNVWVGGYAGGAGQDSLTLLTPTGRRAMAADDSLKSSVEALFRDSRERIWIGGNKSLLLYADGQLKNMNPTNEVQLGRVQCFAEDPHQSVIWAGCSKGLFQRMDGDWLSIKGPSGQPLGEILGLRFDFQGSLWICESAVGIWRLNRGKWSSITEKQGLPTTTISCMIEDDCGYWWLGSNRGVIRTSRADLDRVADGVVAKLPCQVFTVSDGLASIGCAMRGQSPALKDSQGKLWFATLKGVAMVDPRLVKLNTNPPSVYLESIEYLDRRHKRVTLLDGQTMPFQNGTSPKLKAGLTFPPGSSQMEARFAALSFTAPEKVQLKYTVTRNQQSHPLFEKDERTLSVPWLPPGYYQLQVTAANNDGIWNAEGAKLAFVVLPYYWQTHWFRGLAMLAFGGGIAGGVGRWHRNRLRRTEALLRQQEALAQERARTAALTQHASDAIVLLNAEGRVIYESAAAPKLLGYAPGFLLDKDPIQFIHPEDEARVRGALQTVMRSTHVDNPIVFRLQHAQGYWLQLESLATNLLSQPGVHGILVTTRDITSRMRAEEALRTALEEKTVLLKEVHHRVKNNLQIVCSLLSLQSVRTRNPEALDTLLETGNRVRSMAILHETLYRSGNLARVDFAGYIESICAHLFRSYGGKTGGIGLELRIENVALELDQAVSCGLIVNELVSNAIKHAFPEGRSGRITVEMRPVGHGRILLTVADDGVGFPPQLDLMQTETLGHQLVHALADKLDGKVEANRERGTLIRIEFLAARTGT